MDPSPQQKAILEFLKKDTRNLVVQACAGSGKTTTLKLICDALPRSLRIIALCFNKVNAETFAKKLPGHVESSTMHSVGFRAVKKAFPAGRIESNKSTIHAKKVVRGSSHAAREMQSAVQSVASLCVNTMTDPNDPAAFNELLLAYNAVPEAVPLDALRDNVAAFIASCRSDRDLISFDDMLDFPVALQLQFPSSYDVILGDEVQDWNRLQAAFVQRMVRSAKAAMSSVSSFDALDDLFNAAGMTPAGPSSSPVHEPSSTRVVLVGDSRQSIYAFRGADTDSMANLATTFSCVSLPLSVCYRCPVPVIELAQDILQSTSLIEPCDTPPAGSATELHHSKIYKAVLTLPAGAMVLCRNNAPLVRLALHRIRERLPALVRGRDIGVQLARIADSAAEASDGTLSGFRDALMAWQAKRAAKYIAEDRPTMVDVIADQVVCIWEVASSKPGDFDAESVGQDLRNIFSDATPETCVVFSSGHRSKGLEAETVLVFGHGYVPPYARTEAELLQERNLRYVMVTRAMRDLILVPYRGSFSEMLAC